MERDPRHPQNRRSTLIAAALAPARKSFNPADHGRLQEVMVESSDVLEVD
ncbi:MAG: hypothetical protein Q7S99_14355 [Parvibaculum sp.]|nr:hypothetical protein [Parvibaculum sp.]